MTSKTLPVVEEIAIRVFDPVPAPIIDTEVSEPMLTWDEGLAWLDANAPDWRNFRARPPWHYVFHARWFDVRELREWVGR